MRSDHPPVNSAAVPDEIRTKRLVLRRQAPDEAQLVKAAVDASLEHLQASVAWAQAAPMSLPAMVAHLATASAAFDAGAAWAFSIFDPARTRILGGAALEPAESALAALVGPNAFETGYWLRSDALGHGYATEATAHLIELAFTRLGAEHVAVCHDPANAPSEGIPGRLGFRCAGIVSDAELPGRQAADGSIRRATKIWVLDASARASLTAWLEPPSEDGSAVVIRRFSVPEWRQYRELRLRALADSPDAFGSTHEREAIRPDADWEDRLRVGATSDLQLPLVAQVGERHVGLAWGRRDDHDPTLAHVFQVWVDPHYRGHGIGRALLDAVIAWARNLGVRTLRLGVTPSHPAALRLYRHAGFVNAGEPERLREGSSVYSQPMQLDLPHRGESDQPPTTASTNPS